VAGPEWHAPPVTLTTIDHAAGFLRSQGMSDDAAHGAAPGWTFPLTLTMRGCFACATKG
jgi:hypothetical protein